MGYKESRQAYLDNLIDMGATDNQAKVVLYYRSMGYEFRGVDDDGVFYLSIADTIETIKQISIDKNGVVS